MKHLTIFEHTRNSLLGCCHIYFVNGEIKKIFNNLGDIPKNCVIRLIADEINSYEEYTKPCPTDILEQQLGEK